MPNNSSNTNAFGNWSIGPIDHNHTIGIVQGSHTHGVGGSVELNYSAQPEFSPCEFQGHDVEEEAVEYRDGLLAAYCTRCKNRITFKSLPAGDLPARVRGLLAELMEADDVPQDVAAAFVKMRAEIARLSRQADESLELVKIASALIAQRTL